LTLKKSSSNHAEAPAFALNEMKSEAAAPK